MTSVKRIAVFVLVSVATQAFGQKENKLRIAAASDLKFALDSLISVFKTASPGTIAVTYGSSGKLFEQISHSAPFDLFFSADITYPKQLQEKGLTSSEVYPYAIGRIVLWSKKLDVQKDEMNTLSDASIKKIAIANPAHAPYGKRAAEALTYYKMLGQLKSKLVYGDNISQTAQFVTTGAADIGIVALSLALSPNMQKEGGNYYLIPENSHKPLEQGAVLTLQAKGNDYANDFLAFMKADTAEAVLRHFGFRKP